MKVVVSEGVIKDVSNSGAVHKLHMLFYHACEGRHALIPESFDELNEWLASIDEQTRLVYQRAIDFSARASTTLASDVASVLIISGAEDEWDVDLSHLCIDSAIKLLNEPLGIVLENANNDWCFLYGIMRESERVILNRAMESRWAEAVHGGGSDLIQRISHRANTPAQRLRTFVLFDSDRRHPDELDPSWQPKHSEACQGFHNENAVKKARIGGYWQLRRRYIESYMPKSELAKVYGVKPEAIEAYFRLSSDAQWYFNVKKGFQGDEPIQNAHRSQNLYDAVNEADKKALYLGFGKRVADQYQRSKEIEFDWDRDALNESALELPKLLRLL